MNNDDRGQHPEIGPSSLWFLRGLAVVTILIVLWFFVDAIVG